MRKLSLSPSPTLDDYAPLQCFVAIELSKKDWRVAVLTPAADKVSHYCVPATDGDALVSLLDRVRGRVEADLGRPAEIFSCYEAGYDGFWLHRLLVARDICNHVFDPASLLVNRRARRRKTDRLDAEALLRALRGHVHGEPKVVSVVQVPSSEHENARRLHRERDRLIRERVQHVNRIQSLCALLGIYQYTPLRSDRHDRFAALRAAPVHRQSGRYFMEMGRELQRLDLVLEHLATVEADRDAIAAARSHAHPDAAKIQQLVALKGVGPEFATVLVGEVFGRRFDNRRQLAAFVGLDASPWRSGAKQRDQGIAKAGNAKARTTMIELAWMWLRYQPDSRVSLWFHERVGTVRGRRRRIAIVAVARKLLIALCRYLETGLVPDGARLNA